MNAPSIRLLSLGAGVQSSALLLLCDREPARVGHRPDVAIFADTGDEPREVYRWLWTLAGAVSIPIVVWSKGHLSDDQLTGRGSVGRSPWYVQNADGTIGQMPRQCTRDYKVRVVHAATRWWLGYKPYTRFRHAVTKLVGISRDEIYRMKPSPDPWETNVWPLVDAGMTRDDCRRYVESTGLGTPPRSACVMCPYHSDAEWARLQTEAPDDFRRAADFEAALQDERKREGTHVRILSGTPYLHRSCTPLASIDFAARLAAARAKGERQGDLFRMVCGADCGT